MGGEDGSGKVIAGSWRNEEPATGLVPVSTLSGNRFSILVKHILLCSIYLNITIIDTPDQQLMSETSLQTTSVIQLAL